MHVMGLLALASCQESAAETPSEIPAQAISVDLAAVTLGDDCGPPPSPSSSVPAAPAPADQAPAKPGRAVPGYRGNCNQTSMQLQIKVLNPATFKIKKVELLDDKGKLLEVLTPRSPRMWNQNVYRAWDEKVPSGTTVRAMYDLTMPNWDKLTGGRWNAHTKAFQVRVTVSIGGANKTVEKQSITAARLPPPVPT
jgi:hypothetical protein